MISLRPFRESDSSALQEIERLCPQGDDKCAIGVDKKGDIAARYKMYDNWKILVAEENGRTAGWIGWTVKNYPSRRTKYAYLAEVVVHPEFQRRGVATALVNGAEKDASRRGSDHVYCYIYDPNHASKSLFQRLGYSDMTALRQCAVATYKKVKLTKNFLIENPGKEALQEIVSLINSNYKKHTHFVPFNVESFEIHVNRIPAYGLDRFWVAKSSGKIVACAGLWDPSVLTDLYYAREPFTLKAMRALFLSLSPFVKVPRIAAEGEKFEFQTMIDYAFDPENPKAMRELMRYLNNKLIESEKDYLLGIFAVDDPFFEIVRWFHPQIEIWRMYAKSLNGELADFSPIYVDPKDLIP
jgi:ribosomal protein S18 acetylase RimI-like enzyme